MVGAAFQALPAERAGMIELCYILDPSIRGVATARNRAMEIASGDIWLFLDDDVRLARDFVEELISLYEKRPDIGGIAGLITNYSRPPWGYRAWSWVFERGPFNDERQPIYWNADGLPNDGPIVVRKFTGCAMSFRASVLGDVRFDQKFPWALAEDIDLCARLRGVTLVIAPRTRVAHLRSPLNRARDHWIRAHALTAYYMYRRNWAHGIVNKICFRWLQVGECIVVAMSCAKQRSMDPWRALRTGVQQAYQVTTAAL